MGKNETQSAEIFEGNSLRCELLELNVIRDLCDKVSLRILASGFKPDTVVAIARGGLVPARFIADTLGVTTITTMTVRHYHAGAVKNDAAFVVHPVNADISGQNVLVVDDVNDSGDTFDVALPHVHSLSPANVKTAVVHEKLVSSYRADFVGETQASWRWLIYPWAFVEDVGDFVSELMSDAMNRAELVDALSTEYGLNLPPTRLDHILELYAPASKRFLLD